MQRGTSLATEKSFASKRLKNARCSFDAIPAHFPHDTCPTHEGLVSPLNIYLRGEEGGEEGEEEEEERRREEGEKTQNFALFCVVLFTFPRLQL